MNAPTADDYREAAAEHLLQGNVRVREARERAARLALDAARRKAMFAAHAHGEGDFVAASLYATMAKADEVAT